MPENQVLLAGDNVGNNIPLDEMLNRIEVLTNIGAALSSEQNINQLLELILLAAKKLLNADGGTIYRVRENDVTFEIMMTDSLNISMGGASENKIPFPPIKLYDENGTPNSSMVVAYSVLHDKTVNIPDAYTEQGFDFAGTKKFDQGMGYRSKSFLTIPMKNHEKEIIGVLQLLDAQDRKSGEVIHFSLADQKFAESLASQAAVALTNRQLIDQLQNLFHSFVRMINGAIDHKSPYTGGHCERVPALAMMIAEAMSETDTGPLKELHMTNKNRRELELAGLLHDCGKITTPVHVVDKATKLETIVDRIQFIETRFEVVKRDAKIAFLEAYIAAPQNEAALDTEYNEKIKQVNDDLAFLRHTNTGGEFMKDEAVARVKAISKNYILKDNNGNPREFLTENELTNLTIRAGTLNGEERQIINDHVTMTLSMLNSLPWPKDLVHVPEYAGGHHERMDGKGYPNGLTKDQMSVQARVLGIADIFEALTAKDRPYRPIKTISESLDILGKMSLGGHIDPDLFDIFVRKQVYLRYAEEFLNPEQIDEVNLSKIPGYAN
jgi:HD-GYP domain-containing protein (c-di-GMP phosphodiesterase class II)